jgi:hypothetical protein
VEPYGTSIATAFICNECVQAEAIKIWEQRKAQHNASYPPINLMSQEEYDQYYLEHRQLEAEYARDRKIYERELKTTTRPSNICSALEASKDEVEFATELDSLSLSMMASNGSATGQTQLQTHTRSRMSLPNDASEQLHWDLNTLALDRGSCGIEYSPQPHKGSPALQQLDEDELWRKPRSHG